MVELRAAARYVSVMDGSPNPAALPRAGRRRRRKGALRTLGRLSRPLHAPLVPVAGLGLSFLLQHLPMWAVAPLAALAGRTAFFFARPLISPRALANLEYAFGPALSPAQRKRRLKRTYLHQAFLLFEAIALSRDPANFAARCSNWEELRSKLDVERRRGAGLMLITAHVGSWEFLGQLISASFPLVTVAKRTRNEASNRLLKRIREKQGGEIVFHDESPRKLLQALKRGDFVGIVADHAFRGVAAAEVPFFGHPTRMPTAPFALACRKGAAVLFLIVVREESGAYRVVFKGPRQVPDSGEREERALLLEWVAFLEQTIRDHPENWLPLIGHWKKLQGVARRA